MKKNELDHIDFEILKMLQANARIPLKEIAAKVYLSSPAVSARIETLVNKDILKGFMRRSIRRWWDITSKRLSILR